MSRTGAQHLAVRLASCLTAILELEPDLERLRLGRILLSEFTVLRAYLDRIDGIDLDEDDVRRIETATEVFLCELRAPLAKAGGSCAKPRKIQ
ncbi:MAG: hypothetical protein HQK81_09645 [Desulfovibrionaceae bacterium]|nr:hypothetical protein [Desulfovibrionaceae bacterium]MBF0514302.1 hypothetical protein [Desulfovibrionaceae bacterium]